MNFADFLSRLSEDYPVPDSYIAENTEIFHVQELPDPHPEPKAPVQNVPYFADTDTCGEAAFSRPAYMFSTTTTQWWSFPGYRAGGAAGIRPAEGNPAL